GGGPPYFALFETELRKEKIIKTSSLPANSWRVGKTTQDVFGPAGPACQAVPANRDFDQLLSIRADSTVTRCLLSHHPASRCVGLATAIPVVTMTPTVTRWLPIVADSKCNATSCN